MEMVRLPFDYARCHGQDCDRREECARHLALAQRGPRTIQYRRMSDIGREAECFIAAEKAEGPCQP